MIKERVESGGELLSYLDGRPIYTGDICTATIHQREHICIWVRSVENKSIFVLEAIDYKIGQYIGFKNCEHMRYLGNIYDLAGRV